MSAHRPKGPGGTWKTGQRVPADGNYEDQYGFVSFHYRGGTFPPCIGRDGENANRRQILAAATA